MTNQAGSHKWDMRFLSLALHVSKWSKDPSTQVGAVITDQYRRVVSIGYNGFPRGYDDKDERLLDREFKLNFIIHAERNAILFARRSLEGCTIHTWPFLPCPGCAGLIVQTGISRIVSIASIEHTKRYDTQSVLSMFRETGIEVKQYGMEKGEIVLRGGM